MAVVITVDRMTSVSHPYYIIMQEKSFKMSSQSNLKRLWNTYNKRQVVDSSLVCFVCPFSNFPGNFSNRADRW